MNRDIFVQIMISFPIANLIILSLTYIKVFKIKGKKCKKLHNYTITLWSLHDANSESEHWSFESSKTWGIWGFPSAQFQKVCKASSLDIVCPMNVEASPDSIAPTPIAQRPAA